MPSPEQMKIKKTISTRLTPPLIKKKLQYISSIACIQTYVSLSQAWWGGAELLKFYPLPLCPPPGRRFFIRPCSSLWWPRCHLLHNFNWILKWRRVFPPPQKLQNNQGRLWGVSTVPADMRRVWVKRPQSTFNNYLFKSKNPLVPLEFYLATPWNFSEPL